MEYNACMNLSFYLPPPEEVETLKPEILAPMLLKALFPNAEQDLTVQQSILGSGVKSVAEYVPKDLPLRYSVSRALWEAWAWLVSETLIVPNGDGSGSFYVLSRRGAELLASDDFESYHYSNLLPAGRLDAKLSQRVRNLFLEGDYDTAIFRAFKEVEIRVRKKGGFARDLIGVNLMREAFKPNMGKLADLGSLPAEQQAVSDLFSGAIGVYKNPSSHREVNYDDPNEVAEVIMFANHLLRITDRLEAK